MTTIPEYLFVIFAVLKSEPQVALGSTIGACTLLVTLGYGSVSSSQQADSARYP